MFEIEKGLLTQNPTFNQCPVRFYYSDKSNTRIAEFFTQYHLLDIVSDPLNTFESTLELLNSYDEGVVTLVEMVDFVDGSDKLQMTYIRRQGVEIEMYVFSVRDVPAPRGWRKLGYRSATMRRWKLDVKLTLTIIDNDIRFFAERDSEILEFTDDNVIVTLFRILMDFLYTSFRNEIIKVSEREPARPNNRQHEPGQPLDFKHVIGNEHILFEKRGQKLYDSHTGIEYISIIECSRQLNLPYYPLVHSTRNGTNSRFMRV